MISLVYIAIGFGLNHVVEKPAVRAKIKETFDQVVKTAKEGWEKGVAKSEEDKEVK